MPEQRILVVDDERINVNLLVDLLRDDYKMMVAKNGEMALKAANSPTPPDLILLDIMMPEMDGYEVCQRLKASPETSNIPVIFISAMGAENDETKGLELGAVDYITKPISPAIVKARVKTHLTLQQNMKDLKEAYDVINSQKERMKLELDVGHKIQRSMLPGNFPDRSDIELSAFLRPAKELGGDFYDFFFLDDNTICFGVGDVSGKGVPAALFMGVTKTLLKSYASDGLSPAEVLNAVNKELFEDNDLMMFVTLFFCKLDIASGQLTYCNAGHNAPYIKHNNGVLATLDIKHGVVLGISEEQMYTEDTLNLDAGDNLVIYTDGITEAANPAFKFYEEKRLEKLLSEISCNATDTVHKILEDVDTFVENAEQSDDITILSLLYNGK